MSEANANQQSVVEACRAANERDRRASGTWDAELSECERATQDLADLRAALAVTLTLLRWQTGRDGSRVLTAPTDREVIDAIRRLQQAP